MDDNEKTNPWDALIDDLGAQPDETAFERHQPTPQEILPTVEWSEADESTEESKATPSDWNSLAESLGLEVEEAPEPTADVGAPQPEEVEPEEAETVAFVSSEESSVEPEDESETEALSPSDDLPPLPSQMDQALNETAWEEDSEEASETDEATATEDDDLDGQGISGEAARSAFDALFSDGASGWGSAFLETPKREDKVNAPGERSETLDADAAAAGDDEDAERPKRKRSRRRRRGGKGRKPAGEQAAEASEGDEQSDEQSEESRDQLSEEVSTEEKKKPRRRRSRSRSRSAESADEAGDKKDGDQKDDDLDDLSLDGEDSDDSDDSDDLDSPSRAGRGRQRHRNLPTWSDAIGMIVDANLELHAKSPNKPQSSRGGRGGRGGRRRKKPESK